MSKPTKAREQIGYREYPDPAAFKVQGPNYGEPWSQGVVIATPATRRYSDERMKQASAIERRTIYYNFDVENKGPGRVLVAEFNGPTSRECLARTLACVNAMRGVPDPEAFVRAADLLREAFADASAGIIPRDEHRKAPAKYDDARGKL